MLRAAYKPIVILLVAVIGFLLLVSVNAGAVRPAILALLPALVRVRETPDPCAAPLGPASDFNVFSLGNLDLANADTEGRLAAAGNVRLHGYGVGYRLAPPAQAGRDVVVAGADFTFSNGQVYYGSVAYGGKARVTANAAIDGELHREWPLDFIAARQALKELSAFWASLPANGAVEVRYHGEQTVELHLSGSDPGLNVFHLAGRDLNRASHITIQVPAGSTVLVNIDGSQVRMANFDFALAGVTPANVYFSFPQATTLILQAIAVEGHILAPSARVTFYNGVIHGILVAGSLAGTGQANLVPATGCLPRP